jgi:hypothetical protein
MKFLVSDAQAQEVTTWARQYLKPDPHGDPNLGGAYLTVSVYCDTPNLDVFRRVKGYRKHKYRARRYGDMTSIFLERKTKWGDRVEKLRTTISLPEIGTLALPDSEPTWLGAWFHQKLRAKRLEPACRVSYERFAFIGSCGDGPIRITMYRNLNGMLSDEWSLDTIKHGFELLPGRVILELKFCSVLPGMFKELVCDLNLQPGSVSKYRLCRAAYAAQWNTGETQCRTG